MKALRFAEIKELVQSKARRESIPCSTLPCGIPKGAITEISGAGKTEFVLNFLAEKADLKVAWAEEHFSIFPFGFQQRNVSLSRILFVDARNEIEWVILQLLRAQIFQVVVMYADQIELDSLRRMQLAAEKASAACIWLAPQAQSHWPVRLQLRVTRSTFGIRSEILRQKF